MTVTASPGVKPTPLTTTVVPLGPPVGDTVIAGATAAGGAGLVGTARDVEGRTAGGRRLGVGACDVDGVATADGLADADAEGDGLADRDGVVDGVGEVDVAGA